MRLVSDDLAGILTVWQEARGESKDGQIAVGEVIRNRAKQHYSSDGTIAGTVLAPFQFSGWNTRDPNRVLSWHMDDTDPVVQLCIAAWHESTSTNLTLGALLYYATTIGAPTWAHNAKFTVQIGHHRFYRA